MLLNSHNELLVCEGHRNEKKPERGTHYTFPGGKLDQGEEATDPGRTFLTFVVSGAHVRIYNPLYPGWRSQL